MVESAGYRLVNYTPVLRETWDKGVRRALNGHFMYERGYLEYHADRFADASCLLYRGDTLVGLLPAHRDGTEIISHKGLSFGGWLLTPRCRHKDLDAGFGLLAEEMSNTGATELTYSPSPYPYHAAPCQDDLFILKKLGAVRVAHKLASFVACPGEIRRPSEMRRRLARARETCPGVVSETADIERFWEKLTTFLAARHQARPVHTVDEICMLKARFPENIRFFILTNENAWLAGEVVFLSRNVLKCQYHFRMSDDKNAYLGFRMREWLRTNARLARPWIDLGTSMERGTERLVDSLHMSKEKFGGRGVVLETWKWTL